jgi:hydrogenase nickel incorporation protein HypA/HybF
MHELSISRAILDGAVRHADGRRVVRVSITIGALRQLGPDSLRFYFQIVSRGTVCEGAALECRLVPARMRCECGEEWVLGQLSFRCPRCAGAHAAVLAGDELLVDSIEVEEAQCTTPR